MPVLWGAISMVRVAKTDCERKGASTAGQSVRKSLAYVFGLGRDVDMLRATAVKLGGEV